MSARIEGIFVSRLVSIFERSLLVFLSEFALLEDDSAHHVVF